VARSPPCCLLLFAGRNEERQTAVKRTLARALVGLIGALSVLYVGDWAVWRARVAMGSGMGTVSVGTLIETPLKGNKEEYDWGGSSDVACSRSIFPQAGGGACWWLERHKVVYEQ
jgi:hypothetical protein